MTKEEIARAKELDLLTYFKLVEPGNLKLVGKEYRHKVHSSLTISSSMQVNASKGAVMLNRSIRSRVTSWTDC